MSQGKTCHFKLVLLGDTAVGKSCLVVRFVRDEFFEFQEPTIGGRYRSLSLARCGVLSYAGRWCDGFELARTIDRGNLCLTMFVVVFSSFATASVDDILLAAFLTQTVGLEDGLTVKFEIWDTAGQGKGLTSSCINDTTN